MSATGQFLTGLMKFTPLIKMQGGVRGCMFSFTWISYEISLLNAHKHIFLTHNEWEWQMSDVGRVRVCKRKVTFLLVCLRNRKASSQFYECREWTWEWTHGDCYARLPWMNNLGKTGGHTTHQITLLEDLLLTDEALRWSTLIF